MFDKDGYSNLPWTILWYKLKCPKYIGKLDITIILKEIEAIDCVSIENMSILVQIYESNIIPGTKIQQKLNFPSWFLKRGLFEHA